MDQLVRDRAEKIAKEQERAARMLQVLVIVDPEETEGEKNRIEIRSSDSLKGDGDEIVGVLLRAIRALYRDAAQKTPKERAEAAGLIVP